MLPGDERSEDDEDQSDAIVEALEQEHLGEDVPGAEVGESTGAGRTTTTRHDDVIVP